MASAKQHFEECYGSKPDLLFSYLGCWDCPMGHHEGPERTLNTACDFIYPNLFKVIGFHAATLLVILKFMIRSSFLQLCCSHRKRRWHSALWWSRLLRLVTTGRKPETSQPFRSYLEDVRSYDLLQTNDITTTVHRTEQMVLNCSLLQLGSKENVTSNNNTSKNQLPEASTSVVRVNSSSEQEFGVLSRYAEAVPLIHICSPSSLRSARPNTNLRKECNGQAMKRC
eukprot:scaffold1787_cov165-Cylindrotheca_fusiformis.AAC.1